MISSVSAALLIISNLLFEETSHLQINMYVGGVIMNPPPDIITISIKVSLKIHCLLMIGGTQVQRSCDTVGEVFVVRSSDM